MVKTIQYLRNYKSKTRKIKAVFLSAVVIQVISDKIYDKSPKTFRCKKFDFKMLSLPFWQHILISADTPF